MFFSCEIVVADGGFEESQFYYTTPQANNQAENAENQGKTLSFPPTFCPEPAGQGGDDILFRRCEKTQLCKGWT